MVLSSRGSGISRKLKSLRVLAIARFFPQSIRDDPKNCDTPLTAATGPHATRLNRQRLPQDHHQGHPLCFTTLFPVPKVLPGALGATL